MVNDVDLGLWEGRVGRRICQQIYYSWIDTILVGTGVLGNARRQIYNTWSTNQSRSSASATKHCAGVLPNRMTHPLSRNRCQFIYWRVPKCIGAWPTRNASVKWEWLANTKLGTSCSFFSCAPSNACDCMTNQQYITFTRPSDARRLPRL